MPHDPIAEILNYIYRRGLQAAHYDKEEKCEQIRQLIGRDFVKALPKPKGWVMTKSGKEDYYTVSDIEHALKACKLGEDNE